MFFIEGLSSGYSQEGPGLSPAPFGSEQQDLIARYYPELVAQREDRLGLPIGLREIRAANREPSRISTAPIETMLSKFRPSTRANYWSGSTSQDSEDDPEMLRAIGGATHRARKGSSPIIDELTKNQLRETLSFYSGQYDPLEVDPDRKLLGKKYRPIAMEDFLGRLCDTETWRAPKQYTEEAHPKNIVHWYFSLKLRKRIIEITFVGALNSAGKPIEILEATYPDGIAESSFWRFIGQIQNAIEDDQLRTELAAVYGATPEALAVPEPIQRSVKGALKSVGAPKKMDYKGVFSSGIFPYGDSEFTFRPSQNQWSESTLIFHRCKICRSVESISLKSGVSSKSERRAHRKLFKELTRTEVAPWHELICAEGEPELEGYYTQGYRDPSWNGKTHSYGGVKPISDSIAIDDCRPGD